MHKSLSLPLSIGTMLIGAIALGVSYSPISFWPGAVLGVTLFTIGLKGRRTRDGLLLGFSSGIVTNAITIGWVSVLGWYVGVGLVLVMSLWTMLLAWLTMRVQRLSWWPVLTASCWSVVELGAATVPFGGFGWNRLAFTTADQPLSGFLPLIGVAGVSWVVALCGSLLAASLVGDRPPTALRRVIPLGVVLGIFLLGAGAGLVPSAVPRTEDTVNIGIVQGNVDGTGRGNLGYARSVTNNHFAETIVLMAKARTGLTPMPDFLLWPENSTDIDPTTDGPTRRQVELSAAIAGRPILVGAVMEGPGENHRQTTGLWWDPVAGPVARYDKRNLVPFGEWIPFRDILLPRFPILKETGRQSVPGTTPGVMSVSVGSHRQLRVGDVICFDLAYDDTIYDVARNGAQLLVVQSSNVTFTSTAQPHQQFEITRIRAMEAGREIVVATTSSFSGLIQPDGTVTTRTAEASAASMSVTIPLREGTTIGIRLQPWLSWGLALLGFGAVVASYLYRQAGKINE